MLQTGAFKKTLLAHRNKVHVKGPGKEAPKKEEEPEEQPSFFANQFWKAPDICETTLEDLLKEEGFYEE